MRILAGILEETFVFLPAIFDFQRSGGFLNFNGLAIFKFDFDQRFGIFDVRGGAAW